MRYLKIVYYAFMTLLLLIFLALLIMPNIALWLGYPH
jgi:hypothetical protein